MNAKNIFGAFTVAIALFFLWPAVFSSWAEVGALRASLAEHEQALNERTEVLKKFQIEYAKYRQVISGASGRSFLELVPAKKNLPELLSAAQAIATNSGIQITTFQMGEDSKKSTKETNAYKTVTLTIEATGSYPALRSFLGNLESYVRILDVRELQVGVGKQEGILGFKITANTYFTN